MQYHVTVNKLINLFDEKGVSYQKFEHDPVRTSEEAVKVRPGFNLRQGAKALIVKVFPKSEDVRFVMLVIPGDAKFNGNKVKKLFNAKEIRFATEEEVSEITQGVKVGGVPPFGSLFCLQTYTDPHLLLNETLIFNAGDRSVSVSILSSDYVKTENPILTDIT